MSSSQANLDIISAVSFQWGDITKIVQGLYLEYTQNNPSDTSNRWTTYLPAVRGQGLISWRVRYPYAPAYASTEFGTSTVQTTLCSFEQASATVINYDPATLQGSPMTASNAFFISSLWWGTVDITPAVQQIDTYTNNGVFSVTVNQLIGSKSAPSPPSSNTVFMTYGYVVSRPQLPPLLLLGSWIDSPQTTISVPTTQPPLLRVLGACYGNVDVSDAVRRFINFQQVLNLNLAKRDQQLLPSTGGPTPTQRTLSVLWQYDDGNVQCWSSNSTTGFLTIQHDAQPTPSTPLCRRTRAGESNVEALVWGDGSQTVPSSQYPLAEIFNDKVFSSTTFTPSVQWFNNLDPNPGITKSCHVYYRFGLTGDLVVAAAYENNPISIRPQSTDFIDPHPAKGLLRPDPPVTCFTVTTDDNEVLTLVQTNDSYNSYHLKSVDSTTAGVQPAHFMFVRTNTTPNAPFPMLSAYIPQSQSWAYLGIPPNYTWRADVSSPVTFLIPNQSGVPADPQTFALTFNYEIPARNDKHGLLFATTKYASSSALPYYSGAQIMLESADGSIVHVPAQQGINQLASVVFQPQFTSDPHVMSNGDSHTMVRFDVASDVDDGDVLDSCMMQALTVTKIFAWDLPVLLLDFKGFGTGADKWHRAIADWWQNKVTTRAKAAIMAMLKIIQATLNEMTAAGKELLASDYLFQFSRITVTLYNGDCLWSLFKSLLGGWSWWTVGKILLNLIAFAVELMNPEAIIVKVAKYALLLPQWIWESGTTIYNWYVDCLRSVTIHATALSTMMKSMAKSAEMMALPATQRMLVTHALVTPVLHHLMSSTEAGKPAIKPMAARATANIPPHSLIAFKDAQASAVGLQQEHIDDPFQHIFKQLSPDAMVVARRHAPQFQAFTVA